MQRQIFSWIKLRKTKTKKLWQHLKDLRYSNKDKNSAKVVLEIDNEVCFDPLGIANHFNKFFTTVASTLVDKLPPAMNMYLPESALFKQFYDTYKLENSTKFSLATVSREFVENELKNLDAGKSTGLDGISVRFLKDGASVLIIPITHYCKCIYWYKYCAKGVQAS